MNKKSQEVHFVTTAFLVPIVLCTLASLVWPQTTPSGLPPNVEAAKTQIVRLAAANKITVDREDVVIITVGRRLVGLAIAPSSASKPGEKRGLVQLPIGILCMSPDGNFQSREAVVHKLVKVSSPDGSSKLQALKPDGSVHYTFTTKTDDLIDKTNQVGLQRAKWWEWLLTPIIMAYQWLNSFRDL